MKFLNKIFNYLIGAGLVGYGFFFYFKDKSQLNSRNDQLQVTHSSSVDPQRMVNKHLQQTSQNMIRGQAEQKKMIDAAIRESMKLKEKPMPIPDIPLEAQLHKNTIILDKPSVSEKNSNPKLNSTEAMDKNEYARQFIENARKGGYEIELSEDLEVIKATPIRSPSNNFDQVEILPSN